MFATALLIDDDAFERKNISAILQSKLNYGVVEAESGKHALDILKDKHREIQIIILDIIMPDMDGLETLEFIKEQYQDIPVIMLTGSDDVGHAVKAMKLGAVDFLSKPTQPERLSVSITNALKMRSLSNELTRLIRKDTSTTLFEDLIGFEDGLSEIVNIARKAASTDIPVLITGETGVGKELFARAIHGESARAGGPFVAVNCGAIPKDLAESTLFGHEKGAFTGAVAKAIGKFREAEGGTIFLDEIGELPLEMQVKLLRTIQQKEIQPVGADKTLPTNVRIISATNRNLPEEVAAGRFREDLFFRLDVLPIRVPALKERKGDIELLARHFIEHFVAMEHLPLKQLSDEAVQLMLKHDWPGNVRELENVIRRALVLGDETTVTADDIKLLVTGRTLYKDVSNSRAMSISLLDESGEVKPIEDIEQEAMEQVMEYCDQNVTKASKLLGIAKSTFYRKWGHKQTG